MIILIILCTWYEYVIILECKRPSRTSHTPWHNNSKVQYIIDPKHECSIFFIVTDDAEQSSNNCVNGTTVIKIVDSEGISCLSKPRGVDSDDIIVPIISTYVPVAST